MDIKKFLWAPVFAGMAVLSAQAVPPTGITIDYDLAQGLLHIIAKHPTDRPDRYYLRKVEIYKNNALENSVNFGFQKLAWGMDENVQLKAQPGDHIKVQIYSSEGGSGEAEMTIPEPANNVTTQP